MFGKRSIFTLSSVDKTSLHDLTTFNQIFRLAPSDEAFTSPAIHPDFSIRMDTMANTLFYPLYTTHKNPLLLRSSRAPASSRLLAPRTLSLSLAYWLLAAHTLPDFDLCRELDINDRI